MSNKNKVKHKSQIKDEIKRKRNKAQSSCENFPTYITVNWINRLIISLYVSQSILFFRFELHLKVPAEKKNRIDFQRVYWRPRFHVIYGWNSLSYSRVLIKHASTSMLFTVTIDNDDESYDTLHGCDAIHAEDNDFIEYCCVYYGFPSMSLDTTNMRATHYRYTKLGHLIQASLKCFWYLNFMFDVLILL